ncbi:MAG: carboxypeptidase regulatory-like domain-containing protein [Sedimentisphaerales bacterium]|nr:carboxypeptidase regulatory-like domain-containing protein [Sedimentisphaerales bacterium]
MTRSLRTSTAAVFTALALCGGASWGQARLKQVECSGTVVDEQGRPVADAEVLGAEQLYEYAAGRTVWRTPSRATTGPDGRFRVQVGAERKDYVWVVAWKKGLSLGWQWLRTAGSGGDLTVRLGEPAVLAGVVVDESGKPVAGATVRPCLKMDWMGGSVGVRFDEPREWFTARTDEQGRFRFDHIPATASADFWVEAPGWASGWTYWEEELSDLAGSQFKAGQTDIRIVVKPEAIIQGKIIDEDSGKGVSGVVFLARPNARYANYSCVAPVTSGPDGAFTYRGLAANDYSLQIVAPQDRTADWTGRDVKVTAVAGQTIDVNIPVSKGGLIEIAISDAATAKPIENAKASIRQQANFGLHPCWYHSAYADAEGVIRLRAPAGECSVVTWADAYNYFRDPESLVVSKGQVLRREVRLDPFPVVTGTVHDPNGRPAAGVIVSSKPICEEPARTDEEGRFQVAWRPSASVRNVLLLARDPKNNLAGLADVKDQAEPVDVTLARAFLVRGLVTDPNARPIPQAKISLRASMPGWLTDAATAVLSDANGIYEARAIPAPREGFTYRLEAEAQGYGPTEVRTLPFDDAQDRLVSVETITLPVADKSISGVVVDANGAPAPGLPIFISGPRGGDTAGQPSRRTVSDALGQFSVDGVCAGPLRIQASFSSNPGGAGFLNAHGGDSDVKVVLGRDGIHIESKSLLGKPLPNTEVFLDLPAEQTQGKRILLCFFDMNQRPSRHCIGTLTKRADALRQKDVIVAGIQATVTDEETWNAWAAERNIQIPLGRIKKDAEKAKSAWGVQSLPWLILTDAEHVVRAEGFALSELERKLETQVER